MALMSSFSDPFNQNTLNGTNWTQFTAGSATMAYSSAGATMTYPASTTSSTDGDISSNSTYNLTGNFGYLQVLASVSNANCDNTLRLGTSSNCLQIQHEGSNIYFQKVVGGTQTNITNVTYSGTTHKWWCISEGAGRKSGTGVAGTTYWETSPDGVTWTLQTSQATPITVTALGILIAGTAFGTASSPGTFQWNNFNTSGSIANTSTQTAAASFSGATTKLTSKILQRG